MKNFDNKIATLKTTTDGGKFCDALAFLNNRQDDLEAEQYIQFVQALIEYAASGPVTFHRGYALSAAIDLIESGSGNYAETLLQLLNSSDSSVEYWAVAAYAKSMGKSCYDELVSFVLSPQKSLASRCHAVKELAKISKQCFDMGKPADAGYWTEADLGIKQILAWQKGGYQDGEGYPTPLQHASLAAPQTPLEKHMAKLEAKLKQKRAKHQDAANPSNWLAMVEQAKIEEIKKFILPYKLPEEYEIFLSRYSPLDCEFKIKGKGPVNVYSAYNLLDYQQGYSLHEAENIPGWPEAYLVIADCQADPFCLDLAQENSTVYFAYHDSGAWKFEKYSADFLAFIRGVLV